MIGQCHPILRQLPKPDPFKLSEDVLLSHQQPDLNLFAIGNIVSLSDETLLMQCMGRQHSLSNPSPSPSTWNDAPSQSCITRARRRTDNILWRKGERESGGERGSDHAVVPANEDSHWENPAGGRPADLSGKSVFPDCRQSHQYFKAFVLSDIRTSTTFSTTTTTTTTTLTAKRIQPR